MGAVSNGPNFIPVASEWAWSLANWSPALTQLLTQLLTHMQSRQVPEARFLRRFPFLCRLGNTSTYLPSGDSFETYTYQCMPALRIGLATWYAEWLPFISGIVAAASITNVQMCDSLNSKGLSVIYGTLISLFGKCVLSLFWLRPTFLFCVKPRLHMCVFKSRLKHMI